MYSQGLTILLLPFMVLFLTRAEGRCRKVQFTYVAEDRELANHSIRTILPIIDPETCMSKCFMDNRCFTVNICKNSDGSVSCNLLDSDHVRHKEDLVEKQGCTYYGSESACSSSPCVKNATCEGDFQDDPVPFKCVCPAGFTGQACQIDIDECTSQGACHVNATCTNTIGGFNCTCKRGFVGDGKICHALRSCKDVKDLGLSSGDGEYVVYPDGQSLTVYCDMTTDSGGWTLIKQAKLNSTNPHQYGAVTSDDYRAISNSRDFRQSIVTTALQQLRLVMGFHQIRFRCHKNSIGRTLHIMTTNDTAGHKVLDHFLVTATWPPACGSFLRLPDDTSIVSRNCAEWGRGPNVGINRWGRGLHSGGLRIYNLPINWENKHAVSFDSRTDYQCDDYTGTVNIGDIWELYFR